MPHSFRMHDFERHHVSSASIVDYPESQQDLFSLQAEVQTRHSIEYYIFIESAQRVIELFLKNSEVKNCEMFGASAKPPDYLVV